MTPEARFEELLETARNDSSILGLILDGSRAAGLFVRDVESLARAGGHGDVFDGWGPSRVLLRAES